MKHLVNFLIFLFLNLCTYSQLEFTGQFRPRFEYRGGYKTILGKEQIPSIHVDQRARLNLKYTNEKLTFKMSIQDIRVWGNTSQLNTSDDGLSIHEAWCKLDLKPKHQIKFGRQEIVYDNDRIFGNVDWVQQGRKHDAFLYTIKSKVDFDLGIAYNSSSAPLSYTGYQTANNYKTLIYGRLNWKRNTKTDLSIYSINIGNESVSNFKTLYLEQTSGAYFNQFLTDKLSICAEGCSQFGKENSGKRKFAYMGALKLNHNLSQSISYSIGSDILSGNNAGKNVNSFDPLFGTHHKFYGLMDYFYVGNNHGNVGLNDFYLSLKTKINKLHSVELTGHYFMSNVKLPNNENELGIETDLVYSNKFNDYCKFFIGYSLMAANENMELIKQQGNLLNHWGWIMLDINVDFLKLKK